MNTNIAHSEMVRRLIKPGDEILRTLSPLDASLMHNTFGISGEAGELLDSIKKAIIYRQPIDVTNVTEELGDLEFYLEGLRQDLNITREATLQANMVKLAIRYPDYNYSDRLAKERFDKKTT